MNREIVPEWRPKYLDYHLLKDHLRRIPLGKEYDRAIESQFMDSINRELTKIAGFYHQKQAELQSKYTHFHQQFSKRDLINLYTEIELLKSFQSLNSTALRKILKKFHKVTGNTDDIQQHDNLEWKDSELLDKLTGDLEDLFTRKFAAGDRHRAMQRLRLRNFRNETFHLAAYFAGLSWGCTLLILIYTCYSLPRSPEFYSLAAQFGLFVALGLFSLNCLLFKRSNVNYRFVFQFDKRTALHECQFAALTGFLACVFVIAGYLVLYNKSSYLIPIFVTACLFFNPTNWLWSSARFWMIKRVGRIAIAPFKAVEFPDFFLNDHLISLSSVFQGIAGQGSDSWISKCIALVPYTTRNLQCLRRYKDTKIRLNLLNASKYSMAMSVILLRAFLPSHLVLNCFLQTISSLFSLYWDLVMDFGLLNDRYLLRKQLVVFPFKCIYYYVVLFNSIARFTWIMPFTMKKLLSVEASLLIISYIEIFRRFHWSLLRIEYEHLNNCNSFRAVAETKLLDHEEGRTSDLYYKDMSGDGFNPVSVAADEEKDEEEDCFPIVEDSV